MTSVQICVDIFHLKSCSVVMDTESDVLASDFDLIQLEDINVAARRMCEFVVSRKTLKSSV